jgi:hypothetical protein
MGTTFSRGEGGAIVGEHETFESVEPNIYDVCKDVECHRDWKFHADTGVLPSSTSLKINMPEIYDVDIQYSSISYAIAYILSYESITLFRPSVKFIDTTMKHMDRTVCARMAIKSVQKYGVCEEKEYVDDGGFPSKECLVKAHNFNRIGYYKIGFQTIKKAICMGFPVILCLEIFDNNQISQNVIHEPQNNNTSLGSIAILLTGFDDSSNTFEFLNCVTSEWSTCNYSVIKEYGHSMWIVKISKIEDILEII